MRRVIVAAVIGALALAPAAGAKDRVVAHLTKPLATAPSGGILIEFSLVAEDGSPFSASGIYVKAHTKDGRVLETWPEDRGGGRFAGLLPTRRSELIDLQIGLVGYASPGGRSDMMFPIADDPFPGPPPAAADVSPGRDRSLSSDAAIVATAILLVLAIGLAARRTVRVRRIAGSA